MQFIRVDPAGALQQVIRDFRGHHKSWHPHHRTPYAFCWSAGTQSSEKSVQIRFAFQAKIPY
jgi:hypothetical protein